MNKNNLVAYVIMCAVTVLLLLLAKSLGLIVQFETKEVVFLGLGLALGHYWMAPALSQTEGKLPRRVVLSSATVAPLMVAAIVITFSRLT